MSHIILAKSIISHGHMQPLPPQGQLVVVICGILFSLVGYGIYLTFGPGKDELKDAIDEHAKMHELGIAHGHTPSNKEDMKIYFDTFRDAANHHKEVMEELNSNDK